MKLIDITLRTVVGGAVLLTISSCTLEPINYSSASGSYRTSSGRINTSVFVSTGNPRWGYDPHCRSYYDYTKRCYYDPYLNGYYPRGHRPIVVIGTPHPHSWRPGRSVCPPPRNIRSHNLRNYHQRDVAYHKLNHSWAKKVKVKSNNGNHWGQRKGQPGNPWQTQGNSRDTHNDHRSTNNNSNHTYRRDSHSRTNDPTTTNGRPWSNNRSTTHTNNQATRQVKTTGHSNHSSGYSRTSNSNASSNHNSALVNSTSSSKPNVSKAKKQPKSSPPSQRMRPTPEVKPSKSNPSQTKTTKKSNNVRGR